MAVSVDNLIYEDGESTTRVRVLYEVLEGKLKYVLASGSLGDTLEEQLVIEKPEVTSKMRVILDGANEAVTQELHLGDGFQVQFYKVIKDIKDLSMYDDSDLPQNVVDLLKKHISGEYILTNNEIQTMISQNIPNNEDSFANWFMWEISGD